MHRNRFKTVLCTGKFPSGLMTFIREPQLWIKQDGKGIQKQLCSMTHVQCLVHTKIELLGGMQYPSCNSWCVKYFNSLLQEGITDWLNIKLEVLFEMY